MRPSGLAARFKASRLTKSTWSKKHAHCLKYWYRSHLKVQPVSCTAFDKLSDKCQTCGSNYLGGPGAKLLQQNASFVLATERRPVITAAIVTNDCKGADVSTLDATDRAPFPYGTAGAADPLCYRQCRPCAHSIPARLPLGRRFCTDCKAGPQAPIMACS